MYTHYKVYVQYTPCYDNTESLRVALKKNVKLFKYLIESCDFISNPLFINKLALLMVLMTPFRKRRPCKCFSAQDIEDLHCK